MKNREKSFSQRLREGSTKEQLMAYYAMNDANMTDHIVPGRNPEQGKE